jgi:hypothetical protein
MNRRLAGVGSAVALLVAVAANVTVTSRSVLALSAAARRPASGRIRPSR